MKRFILLFVFLAFFGCKEKTVETISENIHSSKNDDIYEKQSKEIVSGNIKVVDFEGLKPLLAKNNDTTYVINFWATWCKPCIKELPYFEELNKKYSEQKVKVILVSLDFPEKLETQVKPFVSNRGLVSEVILLDDADANSWIPKIDKDWSGAIPATLIYNRGKRKFFEKSFRYEELETELKSIL